MQNVFASKVTPAPREQNRAYIEKQGEDVKIKMKMFVMLLHNLTKGYGGQRHPKIESYERYRERGELIMWKHFPPESTVIYVSHEWAGTDHPDPHGDQMYHLLLLLERLQRGDVGHTDMDTFV